MFREVEEERKVRGGTRTKEAPRDYGGSHQPPCQDKGERSDRGGSSESEEEGRGAVYGDSLESGPKPPRSRGVFGPRDAGSPRLLPGEMLRVEAGRQGGGVSLCVG